MISNPVPLAVLGTACGLATHPVLADTIYDESTSGDLSNSGLNPTLLTVGAGDNDVFGTTGRGANGVDRDYFTFTVPNGLAVTAIVVLPGTATGDDVSFIGVQSGSQVTLPGNAPSAEGLLGWKHYTAGNGNIINDLSIAAQGSKGFTPPLGPGSYAFWVQELSPGRYNYGFDFELEPFAAAVPDSGPGAIGLAAVLLTLFSFGSWPSIRPRHRHL